MVTVEDVFGDIDAKMRRSVAALTRELNSIRTGRASPSLVENLMVDYYGVPTPLNQLSSISVPEARVLLIQPWDKGSLKEVEKSILTSNLGLVPNNDGNSIRVNIPILTEERRRDLVRVVGRVVESFPRIAQKYPKRRPRTPETAREGQGYLAGRGQASSRPVTAAHSCLLRADGRPQE